MSGGPCTLLYGGARRSLMRHLTVSASFATNENERRLSMLKILLIASLLGLGLGANKCTVNTADYAIEELR